MSGLPFDQRDGFIWYNGKVLPWNDGKIHIVNHGLHYGSCVFEGIRAYGGKPFLLNEHNERLIRSAQILDMTIPFDVPTINAACMEMLTANKLKDAYLRPVAWRGSEVMGIAGGNAPAHVAIAVWYWGKYFSEELLEKGISLKQSKWRKPAPDTAPTESKAAGLYMIGTLAKHEAEKAGYADALMLDYRGYVAESSGANLFIVKDGAIKTPIPDCFLNGLTRQTVMSLAKKAGFSIEEKRITLDELMVADEVFLTGTAAELTAVGKINDQTYTVGSVTRTLRDHYEALINA
ncbi:MAG: branched-chain amino acid aminotransferase [Proteobacteria bacterium]|nr:branched-chain amino acid aminotransferase [Pseudomonadota bacterium]